MSEQRLTRAQRAALQAAGSDVENMPPNEERASTRTAQRLEAIRATAVPHPVVAGMLGGNEAVRRRCEARSLLTIDVDSASMFPAFQFADGKELPHWPEVCEKIRLDAPIVSIDYFMTSPSSDLIVDGQEVSPAQWLQAGRNPDNVIRLAHHAFEIRL